MNIMGLGLMSVQVGHSVWMVENLVQLPADRPGLGGLLEDWGGMTNSTPDVSDSLSDEGIGGSFNDVRYFVASFAGNRVSSNFTSREISNRQWAASQNWYPLDPGL